MENRLIAIAAEELEGMKQQQQQQSSQQQQQRGRSNVVVSTEQQQYCDFIPSGCRKLLYSLPGNSRCMDCKAPNPQWASVSFGALLCLQCSGRHRSYGVGTSKVRSITMDTWSHSQILNMLEGGNDQLEGFFQRHHMTSDEMTSTRYHTKAARFYRCHLVKHVKRISDKGMYKGREAARRHYSRSRSPTSEDNTKQTAQLQGHRQGICVQ